MKKSISAVLITALYLGLFLSVQVQAAPAEQEITVLTPLGHPPNIQLKKMAPRLNTLDGKTIYVVDDGFVGGDNLLLEMVEWFKREMPGTNVLFRKKGGRGFDAEDPFLWAEMEKKADAMIIGIGH